MVWRWHISVPTFGTWKVTVAVAAGFIVLRLRGARLSSVMVLVMGVHEASVDILRIVFKKGGRWTERAAI